MIRTDDHIRARFGSAVGAVGSVRGLFGKETCLSEGSVHFIGADVMETGRIGFRVKHGMTVYKRFFHPVFIRNVDEGKGTVDVGLDKDTRIFDAVIDMALGSEMDDASDVVGIKERFDEASVTDVSVNKNMAIIVLNFGEVFNLPRIGKEIEIDKTDIRVFVQKIRDKIAPDKSGASGD
jgi:hypothetical protein